MRLIESRALLTKADIRTKGPSDAIVEVDDGVQPFKDMISCSGATNQLRTWTSLSGA